MEFVMRASCGSVLGIAALVLAGCSVRQFEPQYPDQKEIYSEDRLKGAVVRVQATWLDGRETLKEERGAGILLGFDRSGLGIATAGHVVVDGPPDNLGVAHEVEVEFRNLARPPVRAYVLKPYDLEKDVAVLRVSGYLTTRDQQLLVKLPVNTSFAFRPSTRVRTIGHPRDKKWAAQNHDVIQGRGTRDGIIIARGGIDPGNSGGPIVSEAGRLVGMVTWVRGGEAGGISVVELMAQLDAWNIPYRALFSGEFKEALLKIMEAIWTQEVDAIRGSRLMEGPAEVFEARQNLWGQGSSLLVNHDRVMFTDNWYYIEMLGNYEYHQARKEAFEFFTSKVNEYLGEEWNTRVEDTFHVTFWVHSWGGGKSIEILQDSFNNLFVVIHHSGYLAKQLEGWWKASAYLTRR